MRVSETFVAFDVETANARYGSICAFGIAIVQDGVLVETVQRVVKPPQSLNYFEGRNIGIHGISASTVKNAPSLRNAWTEVMEHLDGQTVVTHNAAFDINALRQAADAIGRRTPRVSYLCTMKVARNTLGLPSNRLPLVAAELGVPMRHHHDAGCDAEAAARIALALMARQRVRTLTELARKSGVPWGRL